MKLMEHLAEALATPEGLAWKRREQTQHFLQTLREMGTGLQDAWAQGHFQSNRELEVAEQACCNTLLQIVTAIEELKLPEKEPHAS